jgi:hypothetical protein
MMPFHLETRQELEKTKTELEKTGTDLRKTVDDLSAILNGISQLLCWNIELSTEKQKKLDSFCFVIV